MSPISKYRTEIAGLVEKYYLEEMSGKDVFVPGRTAVSYAGRVFDQQEIIKLVDSALDFWLTGGRFQQEFEEKLSERMEVKYATLVNSGSSANLLALSALTSEKLKDRRLKEGDEIITVASGFTTTVNPIIQNRLIPVFCDVELGTYNVDVDSLERGLSARTKGLMIPHTLGNPANLDVLMELKRTRDLWIVEDNCESMGSLWDGNKTGTFGDLSTLSFYPSHHITTGEGGAVLTGSAELRKIVESFRDWGRDCWCMPGKDNTCGKRYQWKMGGLPSGYDHKYIYSHIGYNLKATEMQAAIGVAQLEKLDDFIGKRRENFSRFYKYFENFADYFILPKWHAKAEPSWFGFPLTVRKEAPFDRYDLINYLDGRKIATRMLLGGNLTRQPAYANGVFRTADKLVNSDYVMANTFWFGVFPGLTETMQEYVIECFDAYLRTKVRSS